MHRISKYVLLMFLLLLSIKIAVHKSVLSNYEKQVVIKTIEPCTSKANTLDNQLVPVYVSHKEDVDISKRENIPLEVMASKNLKNISSETTDIEENYNNRTDRKKVTNSSYFRIIFDNDIFDNTDYYYTNGVRIEYVAPFLNNFSLGKLLPSLNNADIDIQGLSIVQNIYTPENPDTREISDNDRPFSAYLALGLFHKSFNLKKGLKVFSELSIGVIGPASLGGEVQSTIHDIEPVGWENQISNDFYLNYNIEFNKLILGLNKFEVKANASAKIGTVYNKLGAGLDIRFGKFDRFIDNPLLKRGTASDSEFKYWFFTKVKGNIVAYDATLQGGMFNDENQYVVGNNLMNTFVFKASAGIAIYYKSFGLEFENFYLSPEFKGAYDFRYGRVNLIYGF